MECGLKRMNKIQIIILLENKRNKCAMFRTEFEWNDNCDNIFNMSIERIDNEKGYTMDSAQLVANIRP